MNHKNYRQPNFAHITHWRLYDNRVKNYNRVSNNISKNKVYSVKKNLNQKTKLVKELME